MSDNDVPPPPPGPPQAPPGVPREIVAAHQAGLALSTAMPPIIALEVACGILMGLGAMRASGANIAGVDEMNKMFGAAAAGEKAVREHLASPILRVRPGAMLPPPPFGKKG